MSEHNVALSAPTAPAAEPTEPAAAQTPPEANSQSTETKLDLWARKEQRIRKMQQELQAEREAWKKEKSSQDLSKYVSEDELKQDPLGALLQRGVSIEQLTEAILTGHNSQDPQVKALRAEIRAIKEAQEATVKQTAEQTEKQYQQAITQLGRQARMLVDSQPGFESIKELGAYDRVVDLIKLTFETDGVVMDVEEAAKEVEEELLAEADRLLKLSKVQSKLKPQTPTEPAMKTQPAANQIKTLTNALSQESQSRMSEKDRFQRAILAAKGQLHKG